MTCDGFGSAFCNASFARTLFWCILAMPVGSLVFGLLEWIVKRMRREP